MTLTLPFLRHLVGNPDVYAQQNTDGTWTPVRRPLNDEILERHLARVATVGTYVNLGDKARTLVFDVDDEFEGRLKAYRIIGALTSAGIPRPLIGLEDSGRKGYHAWVVLDDYVPAEQLRRFGRHILALSGVECEVFPKQDEARDLGNLVKLPGGVHQVTGRPNNFIGGPPRIMPVAMWNARIVPNLPETFRGRSAGGGATRFPCLEHIQLGETEGGRNIALFQFCTLMRRAGLTGDALRAAAFDVNSGFSPPMDFSEVENILDSSVNSGPICDQLPEDRQCGDLCVHARISGLSTRPGQLRHASEGESVVVTLGSRVGKVVRLLHDDLSDGKGYLS